MDHARLQLSFFIAVFLAILVLTFFLFQPYLTTLAVAAVFAVLTYPWYLRLLRVLRSASAAALSTVLAISLIVLIPLSLIMALLFVELREVSETLRGGDAQTVEELLAPVERRVQAVIPGARLEVEALAGEVLSWLGRNLGSAFASTAQAILALLVGLIAYFFFLRDGKSFAAVAVRYSPLENRYDHQIIRRLERAIHSVIRGALLIALIQGVLAGIGMALFGVPNPVLLGSVAAIGALIPGIGTGLALVPAILYLIVVDQFASAIGLTIWGLVIVGLVDNILLPKLMSHGVSLHPLFILLSVLGGIGLFGASGILLGPLVLSLLYALGDIYFILVDKTVEEEVAAARGEAPH